MVRALLLMSFLISSAAHARSAPESSPDRRLRSHLFQYPLLQEPSFVETSFAMRQGLSSYRADLSLNAPALTRRIRLIGIEERASLSVGVFDGLALEGELAASALVGQDAASLLLRGAEYSVSIDGNVLVRLIRSEASGTQVAVRVGGGSGSGKSVSALPVLGAVLQTPVELVTGVLEGNIRELILVPTRDSTLRGGLYVAQAIAPVLGLQGSVRAQRTWITEEPFGLREGRRVAENSHALAVRAAVAVGVDFAAVHVPVALLGEYAFLFGERTEIGGPATKLKVSGLGLSVFYSGRENLQLGVGATTSLAGARLRVRGAESQRVVTGEPTILLGQFVFRYLW